MLVDKSNRMITISENLSALTSFGGLSTAESNLYATYRFTFDRVYDTDTSQDEVYLNSARPAVLQTVQVGDLPSSPRVRRTLLGTHAPLPPLHRATMLPSLRTDRPVPARLSRWRDLSSAVRRGEDRGSPAAIPFLPA